MQSGKVKKTNSKTYPASQPKSSTRLVHNKKIQGSSTGEHEEPQFIAICEYVNCNPQAEVEVIVDAIRTVSRDHAVCQKSS